jgi:hypothetical protein
MKKTLFSLFMVYLVFGHGQSISSQLIASSGVEGSTSSAQLTSSTGEVVVDFKSNTSSLLSQGFQQPESTNISVKEAYFNEGIRAFPNPTIDLVFLEGINPLTAKNIALSDGKGRTLETIDEISPKMSIDLTSRPSGVYYVTLNIKDQYVVYKIEKID